MHYLHGVLEVNQVLSYSNIHLIVRKIVNKIIPKKFRIIKVEVIYVPCLKDEEFITIDKLIDNELDQLSKQSTTSAKDARGNLLVVRHKLVKLKCSSLSKYD